MHSQIGQRRPRCTLGRDPITVVGELNGTWRDQFRNVDRRDERAMLNEGMAETPSSQPSTSAIDILTKSDFERCRTSLKTIFGRCTQLEFVTLLVFMSAILNAFRPLQKDELYGLLTLQFGQDTLADPDFLAFVENILEGSHSCYHEGHGKENEGIQLFVHQGKSFNFRDVSMRRFFTICKIDGMDMTHILMTTACVRQCEIDHGVAHPLFHVPRSQHSPRASAFSAYAKQFWSHHYRSVELPCPLLSERVHQLIFALCCQEVRSHSVCTWQTPCQPIIEAMITYCESNNLKTLIAPYVQISASARMTQAPADQMCFEGDIQHEHLSSAFSQLDIVQTQGCVAGYESRSLSPVDSQGSGDELCLLGQRWVLV